MIALGFRSSHSMLIELLVELVLTDKDSIVPGESEKKMDKADGVHKMRPFIVQALMVQGIFE